MSESEERLSKNQLVGGGEQIEQRPFTLRTFFFDIQVTGNSEMRRSGALENGSHQSIAYGTVLKDGNSGKGGRLEVSLMHSTDCDKETMAI